MDGKVLFAIVFIIFLVIFGGFFIKWASLQSPISQSSQNPAEKFAPIKRKNPARSRKRVKFGTNVQRRDYDKSSGDIVGEIVQKINDI